MTYNREKAMRHVELSEAEAHALIDALNRNLDAAKDDAQATQRRILVRSILQKVDNARRCEPDDCPT
jgi:hypothetical protein